MVSKRLERFVNVHFAAFVLSLILLGVLAACHVPSEVITPIAQGVGLAIPVLVGVRAFRHQGETDGRVPSDDRQERSGADPKNP